ncbi:MAG: flagellar biosynthetic protein FliR [Desulfobacterales bacterium]
MAILHLPLHQVEVFFLVFLRVSGVIFTVPIIGSPTVPATVKSGLSLALTFALFPVLRDAGFPALPGTLVWIIGACAELLLGVAIGLLVRLLFAGVQMAGELAGFQMGLAIANIMDPATSYQVPVLAQIYNLMAMLLFVSFNAHHWFIRGIMESYAFIPPLQVRFTGFALQHLIEIAGGIFVVAVKAGAPVIVVLLISSVAFGLLARTVPQMNVFIVAMPMKIAIGLIFVGLSLPFLAVFLQELFGGWPRDLVILFKAMGS